MIIRIAHQSDASEIARAEHTTAATQGLLVGLPGEIPVSAYSAKIQFLESHGRYIVAEETGRLLGHALLDPMPMAANSHVFQLTLVVHPGHLGHGIGRALLTDLLHWARTDSRVHRVELLVRATNERAVHLYRSMSFLEEGRLRNRVRYPDGSYIDDLLMAWLPVKTGAA